MPARQGQATEQISLQKRRLGRYSRFMIEIDAYKDEYFNGVEALWQKVFPNDPPRNRAAITIPAKQEVQPELFLVAHYDGEVIGTTMAGYDGHRGWLYAVAVDPDRQREGVGSQLIEEAERRLEAMGCGKINLQIRADNEGVAAFYRTHGYESEERISMGKTLGELG